MALTTFSTLSLLTAPGRVMKPRPASEQLVAAALARLDGRPARVVDVGTGSGAIAIAIASAVPEAEVWAIDTSDAAVALASANVSRHVLDGRVTVRRGDLLAPVPGAIDLVVANLPYLPASAAASHPDLDAEPSEAVFAAGDGLDPYRRLLTASAERLTASGALVIQLHRRVLQAGRDELSDLSAAIELTASGGRHRPCATRRRSITHRVRGGDKRREEAQCPSATDTSPAFRVGSTPASRTPRPRPTSTAVCSAGSSRT